MQTSRDLYLSQDVLHDGHVPNCLSRRNITCAVGHLDLLGFLLQQVQRKLFNSDQFVSLGVPSELDLRVRPLAYSLQDQILVE